MFTCLKEYDNGYDHIQFIKNNDEYHIHYQNRGDRFYTVHYSILEKAIAENHFNKLQEEYQQA